MRRIWEGIGQAVVIVLVACSAGVLVIVIATVLGQAWQFLVRPYWPNFGEPFMWLLYAFGILFWALMTAGIGVAIWHGLIAHPRLHRRLGLPSGYAEECPRCVEDRAQRERSWGEIYSRDSKRKRLRREEFDR